MRIRPYVAALLGLALIGPLGGCGVAAAGASGDDRPQIVTAFYPLQFLSERLAGDRFRVSGLTKPGTEPHDVELTARQVGSIVDADVVVYLKGFQPAVDEAVAQEGGDRAFDAADATELLTLEHEDHGHDHDHGSGEGEAKDPHVWLDPERFAVIAEALAERLATIDPANAALYRERGHELHEELHALDEEYADGLADCARRTIVTSHEAFHYLADRYDLTEVGIAGVSPEVEPSPRRLAEVADLARETGVTTIFFETQLSPELAGTIAREVGARTAVLNPLEGLSEPGTDYFSVMRSNLSALRTAMGCAA